MDYATGLTLSPTTESHHRTIDCTIALLRKRLLSITDGDVTLRVTPERTQACVPYDGTYRQGLVSDSHDGNAA